MKRTDFHEEYFITFDQPESGSFFTEPTSVFLYFPKSDKAFVTCFRPDNPRSKSPMRRQTLYAPGWSDYFYIWNGEVCLSDCCYRGITTTIRKLLDSNQFGECFKPTEPPPIRWSTLRLQAAQIPDAAVAYKEALKAVYVNGEVELFYLKPIDSAELEQCMEFSPSSFSFFQLQLLRNPLFLEHATVAGGGGDLEHICKAEWHGEGAFHIAASFAEKLYSGGAYNRVSDHIKCIDLANAARESIWGQNYSSVAAWSSYTPWSSWFHNVAWDWTFVAFDAAQQSITCLFATDTD